MANKLDTYQLRMPKYLIRCTKTLYTKKNFAEISKNL